MRIRMRMRDAERPRSAQRCPRKSLQIQSTAASEGDRYTACEREGDYARDSGAHLKTPAYRFCFGKNASDRPSSTPALRLCSCTRRWTSTTNGAIPWAASNLPTIWAQAHWHRHWHEQLLNSINYILN